MRRIGAVMSGAPPLPMGRTAPSGQGSAWRHRQRNCSQLITGRAGGQGGGQEEEATGADPEDGQVELRVGMLATAVLVGRKTAGGGKARDGQGGGGGGPRPPAGWARPPAAARGQPRDRPRAVANGGHGRQAEPPRRSRPGAGRTSPSGPSRRSSRTRSPCSAPGSPSTALLSLFPAIIAGVSIYGLVADPDSPGPDQPADPELSPETATIIGTQLEQVTSGAGGALGLATVIGILTALWSASSGMKAMVTGVNLAYDETESRKFVKLRGLSILLTLGAMVLMAGRPGPDRRLPGGGRQPGRRRCAGRSASCAGCCWRRC